MQNHYGSPAGMKLLPVQMTDEDLKGMLPHWSKFLPDIAKRSKEPLATLIAKVALKHVQPFIIWDEDNLTAVALLGIAYHKRGDDLIGEIVWMTGSKRENWQHLLSEVETYLKDHIGCAVIRPVCRPGWKKFLQARGYHETHVTMEKVL
jgi:hypothetical protein